MQTKLLFELQCFPDPKFLYNSRSKPTQSPCFSLKQSSFSKHSWNIQESLCHPHKFSSQIHVQRPVVSALRRKRRSGSARSTKILLESAYLVASKLKIFPEPIELLIREFCGGNGGGGLSLKGYGGEGSGGWRKRRKVNWVVLGSLVILGIALSLALWKEYDQEMVFGVVGLSLFGLSINVWKRGALDWALGFCCCAALGGFLLKGDLQRGGVKFLGTMKISRRRRKRRWF